MVICGAKVMPPPPMPPSAGMSASSTGLTPSSSPALAHVARFSRRTALWKLITASVPASPAMLAPLVNPPRASIGISGIFSPNVFPPNPGTQSGMVIFSPLMPAIALLISVITALIGALNRAPRVSKIPVKIDRTPSHACRQLPENTPVMNVITPSKMVFTPVMALLIPSENTAMAARTDGTTTCPIFSRMVARVRMTGITN